MSHEEKECCHGKNHEHSGEKECCEEKNHNHSDKKECCGGKNKEEQEKCDKKVRCCQRRRRQAMTLRINQVQI